MSSPTEIAAAPSRSNRTGVELVVAAVLLAACGTVGIGSPSTNRPTEIPPLRSPAGEIQPGEWEQHGTMYLAAGALVLAIAVSGTWLLLRPKATTPVPPHIKATQQLEGLRRAPGSPERLAQASRAVRTYLVEAFQLPAAEMTTAEFCKALGDQAKAGAGLAGRAREFLTRCDVWKFSLDPPPGELDAVQQALTLVETGEARLAELRQEADEPSAAKPGGKAS